MRGLHLSLLFVSLALLLSVVGSTVIDQVIYRPSNLDEYAPTTYCSYVFSLKLSNPNGIISIVAPSIAQINAVDQDSTIMYTTVTFTQNVGISGDLIVQTKDKFDTVSDVIIEQYECLATPTLQYDVSSKPYPTSTVSFGYDFKITTPLTKYLPARLSIGSTSSTQYRILTRANTKQVYTFFIQHTSPANGYADPFDLIIKVPTTLNIPITPLATISPFVGTSSAQSSAINSQYSMSIFNYENNLNGNTFLARKPSYSFYSHILAEGNSQKGTFLVHNNRRGVQNVYVLNVLDSFYSLQENNFVKLHEFSKSLPNIPSIAPTSYASNFVDSVAQPKTSFLNLVYNTNTKVYDRSHFVSIYKNLLEYNKFFTFPYAYSAGSITSGFKISFSYPTWGLFTGAMTYMVGSQSSQTVSKTSTNPVAADPLVVTNVALVGRNNQRLYFRLSISGSIPFDKIVSYSPLGAKAGITLATSANLILGTEYNGVYEFSHNIGGMDSVRVFNDMGIETLVNLPAGLNSAISLEHVKGIKFAKTNIDTTTATEPIRNRAYLDYDVPNLSFRFTIYESVLVINDVSNPQTYEVVYDSMLDKYVVDFEIYPRRPVFYQFVPYQLAPITSWSLDIMFPQDALKVTYENVDEMPPMVTSVSIVEGNTLVADSSAG
ncbi:hypothetical protein CYY_010310, partial [Polysphondylium violaceum]